MFTNVSFGCTATKHGEEKNFNKLCRQHAFTVIFPAVPSVPPSRRSSRTCGKKKGGGTQSISLYFRKEYDNDRWCLGVTRRATKKDIPDAEKVFFEA